MANPFSDGYEVQDARLEELQRDLAAHITAELPPGFGFTLFLIEYGKPGGRLFYISSIQKSDMLNTLTEFLTRRSS